MNSKLPNAVGWQPRVGSLLLIAIVASACGESEVNYAHYDGDDPLARLDDGTPGQNANANFVLAVVGTMPAGQTGQTIPLTVALQDIKSGVAAPDQRVRFEVVDSPDGSASLAAANVVTDANGQATVDLRTGAMGGTLTVRATHDAASALDLTLSIEQIDTGTLRVELLEPTATPAPLGPYHVSVFPADQIDCTVYNNKAARPATVAEDDIATRTDNASFVLPAGRSYAVVVDAMGPGGRALADGCQDDLEVRFQGNSSTIVNLDLIPLEVAGVYSVAGTWDFSAALASSSGTGSAAVQLIDFMANPGEAIYNIIMAELDDVLSFSLSFLFSFSGLDTVIADYINQQIYSYADISTFVAVSNDLKTMLHSLEVESELQIDKTMSDYSFSGREEWKRIKIAWSWQCQQQSSADCGEYVVDVDPQGNIGGLGAVNYEWSGRVDNYSDLVIEAHSVSLNYNALLIYVLENAIIPGLTNGRANSLGEALVEWIDCGRMAQSVIGNNDICDPTGFFCVGSVALELACEAGIPALVDRVMDPLLDQSSSLDVTLDGTATLADMDGNGTVDEIQKGATVGTIAGATEPMTVDWTGLYSGI